MGADALLGSADQVNGLKPDIELDLGSLKDGAYRDGELLAAILALPDAGAGGLSFQVVVIPYGAAMGAYGAAGPADSLKVLAGLVGVLEVGGIEVRHDLYFPGGCFVATKLGSLSKNKTRCGSFSSWAIRIRFERNSKELSRRTSHAPSFSLVTPSSGCAPYSTGCMEYGHGLFGWSLSTIIRAYVMAGSQEVSLF